MSGIQLVAQSSTRIELTLQATQTRSAAKARALYQPSKAAMQAMSVIGASTKLSKDQKRTLTRMIAMVDEYAGGNPKLMRSIVGIANLMAMKSTKNYAPTPMREMLKMYQEEREKLDMEKGSGGLAVEAYILSIEMAWTSEQTITLETNTPNAEEKTTTSVVA